MSDLAAFALALLLQHAPPGHTAFSVEPAPSGRWSSFYGTTVARESAETGRARYVEIAETVDRVVTELLCVGQPECRPWTLEGDRHMRTAPWSPRGLVAATLAVMVMESGVREDVEMGRGRFRVPDDVGGRGRGPGGEACLMQLHPSSAWRYVDGGAADHRGAVESLVGRGAALRRCILAGARLLVHGRRFCAWRERGVDSWKGAVALYVTGSSCAPDGNRKAQARIALAEAMLSGKPTPARVFDVVLFGDSLAEGLVPELKRFLWPRLSKIITRRGVTAFEFSRHAPRADFVVVSLGANDCAAPRTRAALGESLERIERTAGRVVWLRPPRSCPELDQALEGRDVIEPPAREDLGLRDGIHPSVLGYRHWAALVAQEVQKRKPDEK